MLENKVLRKIFEAKRDEITGEWRKLHNALYSSPNTGISNCGTRTTSGTRKVVRWYAIKYIKMVQGAKK